MKLIVLYGPPGVGKLTVARSLAERTGYKLFHNHITIEPVHVILPYEHTLFWKVINRWRLELFELAAKTRIPGMIYTQAYAKGFDDAFIRQVINRVKKHRGQVHFVKLHCDHRALQKRITHPSRNAYSKIRKVKALKQFLQKYDAHASIPFVKSLDIDNTHTSPKKCAQMIAKHFHLACASR